MFSTDIIDTDAFLDMSPSAQALYFHLGMRADDDGFVGNPKKIMKTCGAAEDDMKVLLVKRFLLPFESGVCVIKHWRINNYIQSDRYKSTLYTEEKLRLQIKENGSYTEIEKPVSNLDTQYRLGKVSIGKNNTDATKVAYGEFNNVLLTSEEHQKLLSYFGEDAVNGLIFDLSSYIESKGKKYKSHYATILNWAKRKIGEVKKTNQPKWKVWN